MVMVMAVVWVTMVEMMMVEAMMVVVMVVLVVIAMEMLKGDVMGGGDARKDGYSRINTCSGSEGSTCDSGVKMLPI